MTASSIKLRPATKADLDAINRVIEAAVMGWALSDRIKRLSLPGYRYTELDLDYLDMTVAEDRGKNIVAMAAWGQADAKDTPADHTALLLHGIYVNPSHQQQGIGRQLFNAAEDAARQHHYSGLLVKARENANGFFVAQGMHKLQVEDPSRQYANRFWKNI